MATDRPEVEALVVVAKRSLVMAASNVGRVATSQGNVQAVSN